MKFQLKSLGGRASHSSNRPKARSRSSAIAQRMFCTIIMTLACGIATPTFAAERLTLRLGPFERSVALDDLENFVQTGELTSALKPYRALLNPQVRKILQKHLQIDQNMTEKFINDLLRSADGGRLLGRISEALPNSSVEQLQAALFLAVRQANGLSVLGFLRAYPEENVTVDATSAIGIAVQLNTSNLQSLAVSPILEKELAVVDTPPWRPNFEADRPGPEYVQEQTIVLQDQKRDRTIPVDLYWSNKTAGPLIVLSHGFGSDRRFLTYLARHLASYGFTVAALEHPGSNFSWLNGVSIGGNLGDLLPGTEFIDRPKDISFLLDQLAILNQQDGTLAGKLNTEQVSVIGHSLGGYTALALAGGELNLKELRQYCKDRSPIGRSPADWFQCAAADLPGDKIQLRDPRVVQIIALNAVTGHIFGKNGLSQVAIPTLFLTGTEDAITPSLDHQLRAFSQLNVPKYLIAAIGGTHLSVTDSSNLNAALARSTLVKEHLGKEADPLRQLIRGVSLAFVKQLTPEAKVYQPFLSSAYAQSLSTSSMKLRFSKELPKTMSTWFQVLAIGNQQIALRLPEMNEFSVSAIRSFSALKSFFFPSAKVLTKANCCAVKSKEIFTDLINDEQSNSPKIS